MVAFQTRCPECNAKLRFDEPPESEEAIECPRCGHVFDATDAKAEPKKQKSIRGDDKPRKKKKKAAAGENAKVGPKKRKAKKKKSNLFILYVLLAVTPFFVAGVGYVGYMLWFSTGKMGKLMAYVPPECNLLRGVSIERLAKYPAFKDQLTNAMKGPFEECRDEFAKATGHPADTVLDYAMQAKIKKGAGSGTMYVFQTLKPFDSAGFFKNLGGSEKNADGQSYYQLGASKLGVLANAFVYVPEEKVIVVIANQGDQMKMLKASIAAKSNPKETSMLPKLGATGNKVCRGNIWTLMRSDGDLVGKLSAEIADPLKSAKGLGMLSQNVGTAKMMGVWMYFGDKISYGVAIECDSSSSAEGLAKTMKEGELAKGDDSEIPRDLVSIFYIARNREFSDFLADLKFGSKDACAFLTAKMTLAKSLQMLGVFNRTDMWEAELDKTTGGKR